MSNSVADLINNIENGTLAGAEEIFKDIMDVRAGTALDNYRQQVASNIFNDSEDESFDDEDLDDEDFEDLGDDEDADI